MPPVAASSVPPPPRPDKWLGGRYELLEVAGRGGMGVVWRAHHHGPGRFRRNVAVKQMYPHLAGDPTFREMFYEEARIGALLQDANIAQVYDFLVEDGGHYLVLEWVSGIDLSTYVRYARQHLGRPTRWELVAGIGVGMLRGLVAAHERVDEDGTPEPIVHRDVSPHNILISDNGPAKLIDFGLCLARDRSAEDTDPGMAKGKLPYLAPEIVTGGRPTPATDQFAAGSVLWEALVGKRAFEASTQLATYEMVAHAAVEPLRLHRPDIPEALVEVVHRALARDPADRYPDVREMARELGGTLKQSRVKEDLYAALARTVQEAREALDIGQRTQDPEVESSIPELESSLVELLEDDEQPPAAGGFQKWLPRFLTRLRR